jgi:hypothetical protein
MDAAVCGVLYFLKYWDLRKVKKNSIIKEGTWLSFFVGMEIFRKMKL